MDNVSTVIPCIILREGFGLNGTMFREGDKALIPTVLVEDLEQDGDVERVA